MLQFLVLQVLVCSVRTILMTEGLEGCIEPTLSNLISNFISPLRAQI